MIFTFRGNFLIFIFIFWSSGSLVGQDFECGSDHIDHVEHLDWQEYQRNTQNLELQYQEHMSDYNAPEGGASPFVLPIVFHVIHDGGSENISDAQVLSALDMLNESFDNTGYYDQGTGEKMDIQFCLAKQDPDGKPTSGILRVQSSLTDFDLVSEDLDVKNLSRFSTRDYINVWIVKEIRRGMGTGVAGYAYFPSAHGEDFDGIVVEARYTGNSHANNAILTHEMGHYLGLYHTFQGGCPNNDCNADGDRVCDTPPDATTARPPCDFPNNSCQTDVNSGFSSDQNDMIINYMDYSNLECYSAMTAGQRDRMHFFIEQTRQSLLWSKACDDPCPVEIEASADLNQTSFEVGEQIVFTNTSRGANSYRWLVNGVEQSTMADFSYVFAVSGIYSIRLEVMGAHPLCNDIREWEFKVVCGARALFETNSRNFRPGDVLITVNTSSSSQSYEWFWEGVSVGSDIDYIRNLRNEGVFELFLVAYTGLCADTSDRILITVDDQGLARTGTPYWPMINRDNRSFHVIDWTLPQPENRQITQTYPSNAYGGGGVAFDPCGEFKFIVYNNSSGSPNSLYIDAADGTPLISNSVNPPGLNHCRGARELQVIPVPNRPSEWFIFHHEYVPDRDSPGNHGQYAPTRILVTRVSMHKDNFKVIYRNRPISVNGQTYDYTQGMAVSRTVNGNPNLKYLYATRRKYRDDYFSLDRFIISDQGVRFDKNTGNISSKWWELMIANSDIELSPTEDKIALNNRNVDQDGDDFYFFDAKKFDNINYEVISSADLIVKADGGTRDLSSVLNQDVRVRDIPTQSSAPIQFMVNLGRKLSGIEYSPNGRFLYFTGGGFAGQGNIYLTYLGQIDLEQKPNYEVRLQIQNVPGGRYDPNTGQVIGNQPLDSWTHTSLIESAFDGNLYLLKRIIKTLFVIPEPNDFMPQNLVPSEIDLSTNEEKNFNTNITLGYLPDQIDGYNYIKTHHASVEVMVQKKDCQDNCVRDYVMQLYRQDSLIIDSVVVQQCPDTLKYCLDTNFSYYIYDELTDSSFQVVARGGNVVLPPTGDIWDLTNPNDCIEKCGTGIDEDGDGLIDCDDPDLQNTCCCLEPESIDLGPDINTCQNGVWVLDAGPGFDRYIWQDGFNEPVFTAYGSGTYWVVAIDSCGNEVSDTVEIELIPESKLDLPDSLQFCPGDSFAFEIKDFKKWNWFPPDFTDCDTCEVVTLRPLVDTTIIVVGKYGDQCFSVDTIDLLRTGGTLIRDTIVLCPGDEIVYRDSIIGTPGEYFFLIESMEECDSVVALQVNLDPSFVVSKSIGVCPGDSLLFRGQIYAPGTHNVEIEVENECDSLYQLEVYHFDTASFELVADSSCPEQSTGSIQLISNGGAEIIQIGWSNGERNSDQIIQLDSGLYQVKILDENGCISKAGIAVGQLSLEPPILTIDTPVCADANDGQIFWQNVDYPLVSVNQGPFEAVESYSINQFGQFELRFQSDEGCLYDTVVVIDRPSDFQISLVDTIALFYGDSASVEVLVQPPGDYTYEWTPCINLDCCDCQKVSFSGVEDQRIEVIVTDEFGCEKSLFIYFKVILNKKAWVPNIFSPNGDGINDGFTVFGNRDLVEISLMEIYDRWGELVYRGVDMLPNDPRLGWDGTFNGEELNPGVFTYLIKANFVDSGEELMTGSITLLR